MQDVLEALIEPASKNNFYPAVLKAGGVTRKIDFGRLIKCPPIPKAESAAVKWAFHFITLQGAHIKRGVFMGASVVHSKRRTIDVRDQDALTFALIALHCAGREMLSGADVYPCAGGGFGRIKGHRLRLGPVH
jgi:hypothetical protein